MLGQNKNNTNGFAQDKEFTGMHVMNTYHIEIEGQVDEKSLSVGSPLQMTVTQINPDVTLLKIDGDQSGLIGLLRYLHQQGFVLLSVSRK